MGRRDKQPINEWITVERVCELAQTSAIFTDPHALYIGFAIVYYFVYRLNCLYAFGLATIHSRNGR